MQNNNISFVMVSYCLMFFMRFSHIIVAQLAKNKLSELMTNKTAFVSLNKSTVFSWLARDCLPFLCPLFW